jgi:lysyl-tRNA synthetase class 1
VVYDEPVAQYVCRHGHEGCVDLSDGLPIRGKLVWKVDWPMRWAYERVAFEPAGEDHHAPTGSFSVGKRIVADVYSGGAPHSAIYSFVSMAGVSGKMSGSRGSAAIPANVLGLIEPVIARWLYVRRLPTQSFSIDLGAEPIQRLYDEWDRFVAKASAPDADEVETHVLEAARTTTAGEVDATDLPVSFRLLGSVADITQGSIPQLTRIVRAHLDGASSEAALPTDVSEFAELLRPRLDCALTWAETALAPESRTVVREEFNAAAWAELDELTRTGIRTLVDQLADSWDLAALTRLVYAVPKRVNGLPPDAAPTPELKALQRRFFIALYRLLCSTDTGPRLPTLMLSIGLDRVGELLGGAGERAALS